MASDDKKPPVIDFNEARKRVQERRTGESDGQAAPKEFSEQSGGTADAFGFKASWERAQPMLKEAKRRNFNEHVLYYTSLAFALAFLIGLIVLQQF